MSESSSAVLDLESEDGEAAATAENGQDVPAPLIMEHGYDIAVKVDSPLKQLSTMETFVTYRVRCACARWPTPTSVRRRYNHFKALHRRLSATHPLVAAPPLPPLHSARQQLDRYESGFVALRALALDAFLNCVAKHPILTHSEDFRLFLTTPDDDLDKVFKSENSALNLWGLSSALYGGGEQRPTNGARVKDPEFTSLAEYLQSLQQKLNTLNTLTTKLYKGSAALGTELKGMSTACNTWSCVSRGRLAVAAAGAARAANAAAAHRVAKAGRHNAVLPLLSAYAAAQHDKIKQRDAMHATYVSGADTSDDLHNRLEQFSEALRSDLADWQKKTRDDLKSLLIELADRQINIYQQTLQGWENAKTMSEQNLNDVFKTVSRNAVNNLSPSKSKASMDFEDLEIELDSESSRQNGENTNSDKSANVNVDVHNKSEAVDVQSDDKNINVDVQSDEANINVDVQSDDTNINVDVQSDETNVDVQSDETVVVNVSAVNSAISGTETQSDPLQGFAHVDLSS